MKKRKISIIIPIYNVEKYLERCLNSIIEQKRFEDVEILLIDDGSEDNSSTIADNFAKKYDNVFVYHKSNGGLSDARNYGIRNSTGDYIIFIDSDDCVSNNFLNEIFNCLESNPDIILWNAICIDENDKIISNVRYDFAYHGLRPSKGYAPKNLIMEQIKATNEFPTTVWLGLYSKKMIIENNLWFDKGLLHEDEMWTLKCILEAKKIHFIQSDLYRYRIRENSIMRESCDNNINHIKAFVYIFNSLYSYYNWKIDDRELANVLKDNLTKRYLHTISKWKFDKYPELLKQVNKHEILINSVSVKNKIRAIIFCINKRFYCVLTRKVK